MNIILNTDSYKASHFLQYPPETKYVSSYIESRGGKYDFTLFFGLQIFLKEVLSKPITKEDINEAEEIFLAHGEPFNRLGWEYILKEHSGYLPLLIEAVDEGTIVSNHNVLVQVTNTDPMVPWLVSYIETALLRAVWYPTTVATRSKFIKNIIKAGLEKTSDDQAQLLFKLHDFGARGVSSYESAGIGGAAHLVNFMGTDTVASLSVARKYYNEYMAGFSIPAAEHSTITSWGKHNESKAFQNMLTQFGGPGKLVAVVSDSYDIWNAVQGIWGIELKNKVIDMGGTVVIRPDSGDPTVVPVDIIEMLSKSFGFTWNSKGFKVLPSCVRVIQGDGINEKSIQQIIDNLIIQGFAVDNIAFGMGGELLQTVNRDTMKFAMKASAIKIGDSDWQDVYKSPVTDPGKVSKRGRLGLKKFGANHFTTSDDKNELLNMVYMNGRLFNDQNFSSIRERSNI